MPLVALLGAPLLVGLPALYAWARPDEVAGDPLLIHKSPYLNVAAFTARAAAYFVIWSIPGAVLNSLSKGESPANRCGDAGSRW